MSFPFGELESWWTLEPLESNCRGQNTSHWRFFYIIGKLLKCRCLKWACMTCLDICNTSYGKKKGQESNWQFNSRPQKVGNQPNFYACKWSAIHWSKALDENYNFALDLIPIGSYGPAKLQKSNLNSFETPLWESRDKKAIWMGASRRGAENTIWGKVVASPESMSWWVLWVQSHMWLVLAPKVLQHSTNQLVVGWMHNWMNE
jgi:hypothetical protein